MPNKNKKVSNSAIMEYKKRKYDRIELVVAQGVKDQLRQLAAAAGVSVNRYILEAVEARAGVPVTLGEELEKISAGRRSAAGAAQIAQPAADGQPAGGAVGPGGPEQREP